VFEIENLHTAGPLQGKLNPHVWCHHCANAGLVEIDGERNVKDTHYEIGMAPCPMCLLGKLKNVVSASDDRFRYWTANNPDTMTWNRGMTLEHTGRCRAPGRASEPNGIRCGLPTVGKACEFHASNTPLPSAATVQKVQQMIGVDKDPWDE